MRKKPRRVAAPKALQARSKGAPQLLLGDKPIKSEDEDILGFGPFADALAKSLVEMAPDDGLVISIEGAWGAGKTSAIELTQRRIIVRELARELQKNIEEIERRDWTSIEADWNARKEIRRTHLIRFNPWNFSGQENLVRAFFTEVGAVIGHPPDGKIDRAIKKITNFLPTVGTVIGGGIGAISAGLPAAGVGATTGRAIGEGAQKVFAPSNSLETAKRELGEALRQSGKRIVVVVDDLDRLLPSEMRAMFSLVKSLGDLPNVLYVLSFDRDAVIEALKKGPETVEANFLEKIIQVPLKLPPPWQAEIRQLFFDRINSIIGDAVLSDTQRWQQVFRDVVAPYIDTPRDVARFSNTLQVVWPAVEGDVDLTDLVGLTALQLFDASVYDSIFENIELLAGENLSFEDDELFSARFDPKTAIKPDVAKKALAHLFPKLAKGWNEHIWDGTVYLKKREQRRICTQEYYRNYFLFGRDPDRVSRTEIETILREVTPAKRFAELIDRLAEKKSRRGASRVGTLLDQILEIVFTKPVLSDAVVRTLLDISDNLIKREDRVLEVFITDNIERLNSILLFGLEPLAREEQAQRVRLIGSHQHGITLAATVIDRLAGHHGMHGEEARLESERYATREVAEEVVADVLIAAYGTLLSTPRPLHLIWIWKRWSSAEEVKSWLSAQMKSDSKILRLAEILPSVSYRSGGDGQKEIRSFKAATYNEFLDVEHFKTRLESIAVKAKGTKARQICVEFLAAEEEGKKSRF
jgi:predicted KAP-like P-loop ATPase